MTDRAKELAAKLREYAEMARANEWDMPIMLGDDLEAAANAIEDMSFCCEAAEKDIRDMLVRGNGATCYFCTKACTTYCIGAANCAEVAMWRGPYANKYAMNVMDTTPQQRQEFLKKTFAACNCAPNKFYGGDTDT